MGYEHLFMLTLKDTGNISFILRKLWFDFHFIERIASFIPPKNEFTLYNSIRTLIAVLDSFYIQDHLTRHNPSYLT